MKRPIEDMTVYVYNQGGTPTDPIGILAQIRCPDGRVLTGEELRVYRESEVARFREEHGENGSDPQG